MLVSISCLLLFQVESPRRIYADVRRDSIPPSITDAAKAFLALFDKTEVARYERSRRSYRFNESSAFHALSSAATLHLQPLARSTASVNRTRAFVARGGRLRDEIGVAGLSGGRLGAFHRERQYSGLSSPSSRIPVSASRINKRIKIRAIGPIHNPADLSIQNSRGDACVFRRDSDAPAPEFHGVE